jgi:hypothetical protein
MNSFKGSVGRRQFVLRDTTLTGALPKIQLLQQRLGEYARRRIIQRVMAETAGYIDRAILADHDGETSFVHRPFLRAVKDCKKAQEALLGHPILLGDDLRSRLLGFFFDGHVIGIMEAGLLAYPEFWIEGSQPSDHAADSAVAEACAYEVGLPQPENVSDEEWEWRRRAWTAFLGEGLDRNPEEMGFEIILHSGEITLPTIEEAIPKAPSLTSRVERLTQQRMSARADADDGTQFPDTPSYWKAWYEEATRISSILPGEITADLVHEHEAKKRSLDEITGGSGA